MVENMLPKMNGKISEGKVLLVRQHNKTVGIPGTFSDSKLFLSSLTDIVKHNKYRARVSVYALNFN
jgi:hypothetical protein